LDSVAEHISSFPWLDDEEVLAGVREVAQGPLAETAYRIDQEHHYPKEIIASLGAAGAFGVHLDRYGTRYDLALKAMREVSRVCGSTGFLTWCHDACGLYMEQSGNPALLARLDDHARARTMGGTGLSNPMKSLTGIEKMILSARKVSGGYVVNGTLPWVSHIARGQYCGVLAGVEGEGGQPSRQIMFLLDLDERVDLRRCPEFSGMEGTSTWAIPLTDYFVSEDQIIADPAMPFIKKVRAAFILLQVGWAQGVIQGAIDSIDEVEDVLGHVNQYLDARPDELRAELDDLTTRTTALTADPYCEDKDYFIQVLDARAQAAELALKASQSALLHQGARGYLMKAAPQRRIREAHFVAIVTPAIKHLRWEMAKLMREETPA
jgi:alkylation response protein AidB-like acyl-CoA dehydrogenase